VKRYLALALMLTISSCLAMAHGMGVLIPGYGVTPQLLAQGHCDPGQFQGRVDYYRHQRADLRAGVSSDQPNVAPAPTIGQSYCDVLAMLGIPDDVRTIANVGSPTRLQLVYKTGMDNGYQYPKFHTVAFEQPVTDAPPVVVSVDW
jgi:hypothetical protein